MIPYDTFPWWPRLHPPLRRQNTQWLRSKQKGIILVSGSTVVSTEAEAPPVTARVIPLAGVVNRYAEHIRRWRHLIEVRTGYISIGGVFSLFSRTTRISVGTVRHPYVTCHCRLCILTHTVD